MREDPKATATPRIVCSVCGDDWPCADCIRRFNRFEFTAGMLFLAFAGGIVCMVIALVVRLGLD